MSRTSPWSNIKYRSERNQANFLLESIVALNSPCPKLERDFLEANLVKKVINPFIINKNVGGNQFCLFESSIEIIFRFWEFSENFLEKRKKLFEWK